MNSSNGSAKVNLIETKNEEFTFICVTEDARCSSAINLHLSDYPFIDSRATSHMFNNENSFAECFDLENPIEVRQAGGKEMLSAVKIGHIEVKIRKYKF